MFTPSLILTYMTHSVFISLKKKQCWTISKGLCLPDSEHVCVCVCVLQASYRWNVCVPDRAIWSDKTVFSEDYK